jgi:hypothetical protein
MGVQIKKEKRRDLTILAPIPGNDTADADTSLMG